jgi:hypothetical protein
MLLRIPLENSRTGERALLVLDVEDRDGDPLSSIGSVDVIPALIALGLGPVELLRINDYRSAIMHGVWRDTLRDGEPEHIGPIPMPGDVDPLYGLTEAQRSRILWLHADRATGRLGGPNDGA